MDRLVRGRTTASVVGPLHLPERSRIVDALETIARVGTHTRVGLRFAGDHRWRTDADGLREHLESVVTTANAPRPEDVPRLLTKLADAHDRTVPLRLVLAGDYLVQLFEHSVGDGLLMLGLPSAVLDVAAGGPVPEWLAGPVLATPVRTAVRETLGRHPERLLDVIRSPRPAPEEPATHVLPWRERYAVATASAGPETVAAIREIGGRLGASFTAVLVAVLRRALAAACIEPSPVSTAVVDARRYLPPGTAVTGNLITGLPLVTDRPDDPAALDRALRGALNAGRPVTAIAAGVIKDRLPRASSALPTDARPATPNARLTVSNMGSSRPLAALPWRDGIGDGTVIFSNRPLGPEDVSVLAMVVGDRLHLSATFHESTFDAERVRLAVELAARNPLSLFDADLDAIAG
jgi:hypothetical protein